ncbi:MAG: hypothetical protein JNK58_09600 [Phycisphaerae bacterium]|nr:hypothetical protein [Phycisphaerae bacterium]
MFSYSGRRGLAASILFASVASVAMGGPANVQTYGDVDMLNQGMYPDDPTAGADKFGLAANEIMFATNQYFHGNWPFVPEGDDYPGTDTMYAGAFQYTGGDGYSNSPGVVNGAQVITIDYSAQVGEGEIITSFTLGIAADDFQFPTFGNAYTAVINSQQNAALTGVLNDFNQTGPFVQFFTIGLDVASLNPNHTLTLIIRQGDSGARGFGPGDGWAIDFLTVGIETVPAPSAAALVGMLGFGSIRRRRA